MKLFICVKFLGNLWYVGYELCRALYGGHLQLLDLHLKYYIPLHTSDQSKMPVHNSLTRYTHMQLVRISRYSTGSSAYINF